LETSNCVPGCSSSVGSSLALSALRSALPQRTTRWSVSSSVIDEGSSAEIDATSVSRPAVRSAATPATAAAAASPAVPAGTSNNGSFAGRALTVRYRTPLPSTSV
jgi:hypothetical protein